MASLTTFFFNDISAFIYFSCTCSVMMSWIKIQFKRCTAVIYSISRLNSFWWLWLLARFMIILMQKYQKLCLYLSGFLLKTLQLTLKQKCFLVTKSFVQSFEVNHINDIVSNSLLPMFSASPFFVIQRSSAFALTPLPPYDMLNCKV